MEVVIESDSDESVVLVDMEAPHPGVSSGGVEMLTDTELDSESDSYEMLTDGQWVASAGPSSAAPLQPPIISIPRYLDGTQPVDVLEVFGRTVSAIASRRGLSSCPFGLKVGKDLS